MLPEASREGLATGERAMRVERRKRAKSRELDGFRSSWGCFDVGWRTPRRQWWRELVMVLWRGYVFTSVAPVHSFSVSYPGRLSEKVFSCWSLRPQKILDVDPGGADAVRTKLAPARLSAVLPLPKAAKLNQMLGTTLQGYAL